MVLQGRRPNRLKKFRRIHGYSQKEIAQKLGINGTALISKWESGTVIPSLDNLLKLAAIYHTLIEELYFEQWKHQRKMVVSLANQVRVINQKRKR